MQQKYAKILRLEHGMRWWIDGLIQALAALVAALI
jgi:hypothetical protein